MKNGWIEGGTSEFGGKGDRQENTKYLITVAWHHSHGHGTAVMGTVVINEEKIV